MSPLALGLLLAGGARANPQADLTEQAAVHMGVDPPACWPSIKDTGYWLTSGKMLNAVGPPPVLQGRLTQPQLYEAAGRLWLGDVDRLAVYDPVAGRFDTLWSTDGAPGHFAFAGDAYGWMDSSPLDPDGNLRVMHMNLNTFTKHTTTLNVRSSVDRLRWVEVARDGHRWATPMSLVGNDGASPSFVVAVEFTRADRPVSAVLDLVPQGEVLVTRDGWLSEQKLSGYLVVPGDPGVLVSLDEGGEVWAMPLVRGAMARPLGVRDVELLRARQDGSGELLVGRGKRCVELLRLGVEGGGVTLEEVWPGPWCPSDGAWGTVDGELTAAAPLPEGAWALGIVEPEPDLLPQLRRSQALLHAFRLLPAPGGPALAPLPFAEAVVSGVPVAPGRLDARTVYVDRAGRSWGVLRRDGGRQGELSRLDTPYEATAAVLGRQVLEQVAFGEGALLRVRDPGGRVGLVQVDARTRAAVQVLAPPDEDVVLVLGGVDEAWAVSEGAGGTSLWWIRPGSPPGRVNQLRLPEGERVGLRVKSGWVELDIGRPGEGALTVRYALDAPEPELRARREACEAPRRMPSIAGDDPVCVDPATGRASWRGLRVIPYGVEGWAVLEEEPERWTVSGLRGVPLGVFERPEDPEGLAQPLAVHADPTGKRWLYVDGLSEVFRLSTQGERSSLGARVLEVERRSLPSVCSLEFTRRPDYLRGFFVDGAQTVWATLPRGRGADPLPLLGPVMPYLPPLRARPEPIVHAVIEALEGPYDPRVLFSSSCTSREQVSLREGPLGRMSLGVLPLVHCRVMVTNSHGLGQVAGGTYIVSPVGVVGWILVWLGMAAAMVRAAKRRSVNHQEVLAFIEQVKMPFIVGPPVTGRRFFGRETLVAQLMEDVKRGGHYALVADRKRIGKTSLLLHLRDRMRQETRPRLIPIYFTMERLVKETAFVGFFRHLCAELEHAAGRMDFRRDLLHVERPDEPQCFQAVLEWLTEVHRAQLDVVVVLLLDEFQILAGDHAPRALRDTAQRLRSLTAEVCRDRLSWVAVGIDNLLNPKPDDLDSDLLLVGPRYALGGLDTPSALRLVREPMQDLPISFEEDAEHFIVSHCGGNPFLIQFLCRTLLTNVALDIAARGKVEQAVITLRQAVLLAGNVDLERLIDT